MTVPLRLIRNQWLKPPIVGFTGSARLADFRLQSGILGSPVAKETTDDTNTLTPVMRQYFAAKEQYPDCLMFCRIGDFYELFYEDAILVSRELQLTLTARDREKKQPMCGVPYHAAEAYVQRLLRKGYKIALCEQMEDPKQTKTIVRREVTRVLTPGTALDPAMGAEQSNYLASVAVSGRGAAYGLWVGTAGSFYRGVSSYGVCWELARGLCWWMSWGG